MRNDFQVAGGQVAQERSGTHGRSVAQSAPWPETTWLLYGCQISAKALMTPVGFAIFCLVGFLLPVPILAWLDRPRRAP